MTVGTMCNRDVIVALKEESVAKAVALMRQHHVGDLVVIKNQGRLFVPIGILTDRDILISVISEGLDPRDFLIGDIMTTDLVTVQSNCSVEDAVKIMRSNGVRRVPVIGFEGELLGIVSLDDIIDLLADEVEDLSALIPTEHRREVRRTARPGQSGL
jgi:CBS domain-containing protein